MRGALLAVCFVLSACGGGGGDAEPAPAQVQAPVAAAPATPVAPEVPTQAPQEPAPVFAPVVPPAPPANIAAWGDSLTASYARTLATVMPDRVVYNGGVGGQTSAQILTRIQADTGGRNAWVNVFWMGRNNYGNPMQIRADVAAAVATLAPGNEKFVVLPILNGDYAGQEAIGMPRYQTLTTLNTYFATMYAGHFVDVRAYLIEHYDPTNPQDVADHDADIVPSSLRSDALHLNARGNLLVAERLKQFLGEKGW